MCMEIDSGAATTVVNEIFFKSKLQNCKLEPPVKKLKIFDDSFIQTTGRFEAIVEFNSKKVECDFVVIKRLGNPNPLCVRNLLNKICISLVQVNFIEPKQTKSN